VLPKSRLRSLERRHRATFDGGSNRERSPKRGSSAKNVAWRPMDRLPYPCQEAPKGNPGSKVFPPLARARNPEKVYLIDPPWGAADAVGANDAAAAQDLASHSRFSLSVVAVELHTSRS
jgi:hypothetical protein